jgi:hypothetical protein
MIITLKAIGKGFILGTIIAISSNFSASAEPTNPNNCPEGWTHRPQEINFKLGACMPETIATPTQPESTQQADLKLDIMNKYQEKENRNMTTIKTESRIRVHTNSN